MDFCIYTPITWILGGLVVLCLLYAGARMIFGAYFKSKEDFLRNFKREKE
jgi:hypothetical protein